MATYVENEESVTTQDFVMYGSSRLGIKNADPLLATAVNTKQYELSNHLGNVLTTVSDVLIPTYDGTTLESIDALVRTQQDYYPFGMLMPERQFQFQPPPPSAVTPPGTLVITEFSNGPSGSCEYVELFVTRCALYPDAETVDIRGWIVDDHSGNYSSCGPGQGISSGHLKFADDAIWANVPVGDVIVLYNDNDNCYDFTANETGTGNVFYIAVGNTDLIERKSTGSVIPSTSNCNYCAGAYEEADNGNDWNQIVFGNSGDAIQVRCPGCDEDEPDFYHGVAYGNIASGGLTAGANDLGGAYIDQSGNRTYTLTGTTCNTAGNGGSWTQTTAPATGDPATPPATVGVVDIAVSDWLLSCECAIACCESFEPLAEPLAMDDYRYGFNGMERDDEIYGAGNSYTAEFWQYDSRLGRRWNIDPVVAPWESPYATFRNNPIFHNDPNGDCPDCEDNNEPSSHTVKKGETLSGIAKQTGTTVENLSKWNNIEDPNKIYAGSTLFTSDPNASSSASTGSQGGWRAPMLTPSNEEQSGNSYMSVASLGLTVVGTGAEATLMVKDYAKLNAALKEGKFIMNYNGSEKIWKMGFQGNQSVSSSSVSAGKTAFTSTTSTLKVVKGLGVVASVGGAGISIYQYSQGEIGGGKLTVDLVMTGVAFVPGVGWVVSGAYFLIDGTVGWENVPAAINSGMQSFERLDNEHRRVTGKGILQGPKW